MFCVVSSSPSMSGAPPHYEQRGGILRNVHGGLDPVNNTGGEAQTNPTASSSTSITEHDYRFPRRPGYPQPGEDRTSIAGPHHNENFPHAQDKLDPSARTSARKELLRASFFRPWSDDAAGEELESPDEMQKKDPLGTQIWRLYSKTKKQLPNQERMENLSWRMMAMNLRTRKQQEEASRYVMSRYLRWMLYGF